MFQIFLEYFLFPKLFKKYYTSMELRSLLLCLQGPDIDLCSEPFESSLLFHICYPNRHIGAFTKQLRKRHLAPSWAYVCLSVHRTDFRKMLYWWFVPHFIYTFRFVLKSYQKRHFAWTPSFIYYTISAVTIRNPLPTYADNISYV